jgi:excinuclease ABC subunit A
VLSVTNAREHNLKSVSVEVPHGALTVVTGPSGSGKSSLVFDVIFAEGQRRFLETLTPYARQFLPTLPKPDVDRVSGVPPAIALEQRTSRAGANSTVSTVTELAHYLRLLFAKLGVAHCPDHGLAIGSTSSVHLHAQLLRKRGKYSLLAPVVEARKGSYLDVFNAADRDGIESAWCDGEWVSTQTPPKLSRTKEHSIDLLVRAAGSLTDLSLEQLEKALAWGKGAVRLMSSSGELERFSTDSACPTCGFSVPELDPRWFSFNTKQGMCPTCEGSGLITRVSGRGKNATSVDVMCTTCHGTRLAPIPGGVRLLGETYAEFNAKTVQSFSEGLRRLKWSGDAQKLAEPIVSELTRRAEFLLEVGLGYLSLERAAKTLSGGELQRLRLAAQLGAGLTGALYVLDEPTIGLHPRDTQRLVTNLKRLVALGSSVVVVEHDAEVIRAADYLIDMGPTGGRHGGSVVASGEPAAVLAHPDSPTGQCFSAPFVPRSPRATAPDHPVLQLFGVTQHNLKRVDLNLPVARLNVLVGVSGSGKSTLIRSVLLPAVKQRLKLVTQAPGAHTKLSDLRGIRRAVSVDQSPIGRTPRSVPATFLGIWDTIRGLFAASPDAQVAGFGPTRFSFNSNGGGRCGTCEGQGAITHEMSFLPDVVEVCPACEGLRFEPETLRIRYRGYSIGSVLKLSAEEACEAFVNHPKLVAPLQTLVDLGAGYIQLGQGSHTLSGGEAQRLKLAAELTASARHEPTLYVLDEPTTGLHQGDVEKLVRVLDRLVERGDTVVVIEHQPWVIASADHLVELGPDAGEAGGQIVAIGTPAEVSRCSTATGRILKPMFRATGKPGRSRE